MNGVHPGGNAAAFNFALGSGFSLVDEADLFFEGRNWNYFLCQKKGKK